MKILQKSIKLLRKNFVPEMKTIGEEVPWTKSDCVASAIFAAESVLKHFNRRFPKDKGPRQAIKSAKRWFDSPSEENRSAADISAYTAYTSARSCAWAAKHAAESAALCARCAASVAAESAIHFAVSAVEAAAESASWAGGKSARDKTLKKIEKRLRRHNLTLANLRYLCKKGLLPVNEKNV